jgi:ophiobolin F synthase
MKGKLWTVLDASSYDKEGLCPGIELRKHIAGELEEVGAFRAQEDWRRLVGPLPKPYAGLLGPDFSFVTISVPDCLSERMEIVAYALEFGFIHDGSLLLLSCLWLPNERNEAQFNLFLIQMSSIRM